MAVIHVLKDGSVVSDISGYVVKHTDAEAVYQLLTTRKDKEEKKCLVM